MHTPHHKRSYQESMRLMTNVPTGPEGPVLFDTRLYEGRGELIKLRVPGDPDAAIVEGNGNLTHIAIPRYVKGGKVWLRLYDPDTRPIERLRGKVLVARVASIRNLGFGNKWQESYIVLHRVLDVSETHELKIHSYTHQFRHHPRTTKYENLPGREGVIEFRRIRKP